MDKFFEIFPTFFKALNIAGIASGSWWVGLADNRALIMSLVGTTALVVYELNRKFKKESPKTIIDLIDQHFVRFILAAVAAPNAVNAILQMIG